MVITAQEIRHVIVDYLKNSIQLRLSTKQTGLFLEIEIALLLDGQQIGWAKTSFPAKVTNG